MRFLFIIVLGAVSLSTTAQTLQDLSVIAKKAKAGRVIEVLVIADAYGFLFDVESTDEEFFLGQEDTEEALAFRKVQNGYTTVFSTANKTLADGYLAELKKYPKSEVDGAVQYKTDDWVIKYIIDNESEDGTLYYCFVFEPQ